MNYQGELSEMTTEERTALAVKIRLTAVQFNLLAAAVEAGSQKAADRLLKEIDAVDYD